MARQDSNATRPCTRLVRKTGSAECTMWDVSPNNSDLWASGRNWAWAAAMTVSWLVSIAGTEPKLTVVFPAPLNRQVERMVVRCRTPVAVRQEGEGREVHVSLPDPQNIPKVAVMSPVRRGGRQVRWRVATPHTDCCCVPASPASPAVCRSLGVYGPEVRRQVRRKEGEGNREVASMDPAPPLLLLWQPGVARPDLLGAGEEEEAGVSDQLLLLQDTGADRSTDLGLRPTPVCLLVESPGPATCPLPLPSTAVVEEREAEERGSPKEASG